MHRVRPVPSAFCGHSGRYRSSWHWFAAFALIAVCAAAAAPARAAPAAVIVSADQALRFGSFFTDSSGSRTVSASGSISGTSIVPVTGAAPGPAQFTITYDRGNNANTAYSLLIAVLLPSAPSQVSGGVTGSLSRFDTDLPGLGTLVPGQTAQVTLIGCARRTCIRSFRVGGTLQVTRSSGGAQLAVPLPIVVSVLAEL